MKIEQEKFTIQLDNGLTVFIDSFKGKSFIHIIGDKGHPNAIGEDALCELILIDNVVSKNSFFTEGEK